MLKKRTRESGSKQGFMPTDYPSPLPSPASRFKNISTRPIFPSSRLLPVGASAKGFSDPTEAAAAAAVMSPTSTLEPKPFSNPFFTDRTTTWKLMPEPTSSFENKRTSPWDINGFSGPVGLGIVDALKLEEDNEKKEDRNPKSLKHHSNRKVFFGSKLRIQIPTNCSVESPYSPIEFGIKTMDAVLGSRSPCSGPLMASPPVCTGMIPADEMELSEDYTCVITHGPNPRTTHIFDNCIVESRGDPLQASKEVNCNSLPSQSFLSFCHTCKKDLSHGKDIYMYRGEKGFCSSECRYREMMFDEEWTGGHL